MLLNAYFQKNSELSVRIDCARSYKGVNRAFLQKYFYPYAQEVNIFYKNESTKIVQQPFFSSSIGTNFHIKNKRLISGVCIIGNDCQLNGYLSGSIIGDKVTIGENSTVLDSILFDNINVRSSCQLKNVIIMNHCNISDGVCLPPGSIIGSRCSMVTSAHVMHGIRAMFQTLWNDG